MSRLLISMLIVSFLCMALVVPACAEQVDLSGRQTRGHGVYGTIKCDGVNLPAGGTIVSVSDEGEGFWLEGPSGTILKFPRGARAAGTYLRAGKWYAYPYMPRSKDTANVIVTISVPGGLSSPISVTLTSSTTSAYVGGEKVYFTATVSGGTPPFQYDWYKSGVKIDKVCSRSSKSTDGINITPTKSEVLGFSVRVTDSEGRNAVSSAIVTVSVRENKAASPEVVTIRTSATWGGRWNFTTETLIIRTTQSGRWKTTTEPVSGLLDLTQTGNSVSGKSYTAGVQGYGQIQGIVTGNTLSGTWIAPDKNISYPFKWVMNPDGKSFKGTMSNCSCYGKR